jgi:hypothetical protein
MSHLDIDAEIGQGARNEGPMWLQKCVPTARA